MENPQRRRGAAYRRVPTYPDFPELERRVLEHWAETRAFDKLREQNAEGERWCFLDGPITANNPMGVHHAWGRTLKDAYQRYHAMNGKKLRYQNGFDCQGLWVEVEVEKAHGFKSKKDIEDYGVDKFVEDCKARVRKFAAVQTEQSVRLGYWMDWDDSYFTMTEENNFTIWRFLRKCHDHGYVYKGFDAMPWCPRCGVGLSQMEMHEGYKWVEDLSVFVRFPIRGRENEALIVWTTTPWTLTSNVAAAVNPDATYYQVKQGDWTYYVGAENWKNDRRIEVEEESAKGKKRRVATLPTIEQHMRNHGDVEIVGEVKGSDLVGLQYDGPFDHLEAQREPGGYPHHERAKVDTPSADGHRVVAWDEVTVSEGTGIVHIAPGCGAADYELSKGEGLAVISPLSENGIFLEKFGELTGRHAHEVAEDIVMDLKQREILLARENYPHRYAHCWRCSTPILYRLVDEWYIDMSWRDEIIGTVPQIRWIPAYGERLELDWLRNMGDWMISKKRYWGLALPIWVCEECDHFTVIGGREELQEKAIEGWDAFDGHTPHRPWIDGVKIACERCGSRASRIPDVGNPWLDAGIVPYSTMGYNSDRAFWEQWFPPELVLECFPGQFRNWFYSLLAMNAMMQDERWASENGGTSKVVPPFKTLLGHALVRDEQGREMHKSWGNAVEFNAAAEQLGADVMRYIYVSQPPGSNLNFPDISDGRDKMVRHLDQVVVRKLLTFWNCYSFFVTYASVDDIGPDDLDVTLSDRAELDRWILSKYQGLVATARDCFENYKLDALIMAFERFVDLLSTWYLRRSRRRFWKSESDSDKLAAYATLFEILEGLTRLMAPVLPFLMEDVYQNLVRGPRPGAPASVHLGKYPQVDEHQIDTALEARIDAVVRYKNLGLRLRTEQNLKVRQPLARLIIKPETAAEREALSQDALRQQILEEVNVKGLELIESHEGLLSIEVKPNFKTLGAKYGKLMKEIQAHLASASDDAVLAAVRGGGTYAFDAADGTRVELGESDLDVRTSRPDGLTTLVDGEAFVALDTNLSDELRLEGVARDFVRAVQDFRKERDLNVADRITLSYEADDELAAAIDAHAEYVKREVLATTMGAVAAGSLGDGAKKVKAGGHSARIDLEPQPRNTVAKNTSTHLH